MTPDDTSETTDGSTAASGATRRSAMERAADDAASSIALTRRGAMSAAAGLSAAALGVGAGLSGSAAGNIAPDAFQQLSVGENNRIVTEDGDPIVLRGVSVADPKRLRRTRHVRGKTPEQALDLVTNNERGWHPRVVRVPAAPADIGEHPMGHLGPRYEEGELASPGAVADDRRKERPPQPPAFDEEQLQTYLEEYYDPIVERCRERGVYCIVDFHRHWHEQPPGEEDPGRAENHLSYSSDYTNYWAYNTYDDGEVAFGEDAPASWSWIDRRFLQGIEDGHADWDYVETEADLEGTPYEYEHWQVNEALRDEAILFWEEAGERYGEMEHVIFEPYYEPTAPGIWGPVEGCGAVAQRPLWDTYVDEFVGPIVDEIRSNYDGLLLVGVPGWCQSVQALHWRSFADAGYEDVAVTWHNQPNQGVSQMHNWFNDTTYNSPEDVEAETGESLEAPYRPPPHDVDDEDCWGWEGYEAGGLQDAMEHHPILADWGWHNDAVANHWIRGVITSGGTSPGSYGDPLVDQLESDPRVSWIANCADVVWEPGLFEYPFGPDEGKLVLDLPDDNFYEPDFEDLPQYCEDLPCEWALREAPDAGIFVKNVLQERAEHLVPLDLTAHPPGVTEAPCFHTSGEGTTVDGQSVCDLNDDGYFRDVTGDGNVGQGDVAEFFTKQHRSAWKRPELFDFSGNDAVTHGDVVELFDYVATH